MLEDCLFERFDAPGYALALHVSPGDPAGKVKISPGLIASSADSIDVTGYGIGAYGASPHEGEDPIYMASMMALKVGLGRIWRSVAASSGR